MFTELDTYDWNEAFDVASVDVRNAHPTGSVLLDPPGIADVVEIKALYEGANDEEPWLLVGRVSDGRWFFLSAWCDYTGWDCQSGGTFTVAFSLDELLKYGLTAEERRTLEV